MVAKPEKSQAAKNAEKAKADYAAAKGRHDATANAANKAAMDKAGEAMKAAVKIDNRERFVKVGTTRTRKARAAIAQLARLANPRNYDYSQPDLDKIVAGVDAAIVALKSAYNPAQQGAKSGGDSFAL